MFLNIVDVVVWAEVIIHVVMIRVVLAEIVECASNNLLADLASLLTDLSLRQVSPTGLANIFVKSSASRST